MCKRNLQIINEVKTTSITKSWFQCQCCKTTWSIFELFLCGTMWEVPYLEDPWFCNTAGSMEVVMNSKVEWCRCNTASILLFIVWGNDCTTTPPNNWGIVNKVFQFIMYRGSLFAIDYILGLMYWCCFHACWLVAFAFISFHSIDISSWERVHPPKSLLSRCFPPIPVWLGYVHPRLVPSYRFFMVFLDPWFQDLQTAGWWKRFGHRAA